MSSNSNNNNAIVSGKSEEDLEFQKFKFLADTKTQVIALNKDLVSLNAIVSSLCKEGSKPSIASSADTLRFDSMRARSKPQLAIFGPNSSGKSLLCSVLTNIIINDEYGENLMEVSPSREGHTSGIPLCIRYSEKCEIQVFKTLRDVEPSMTIPFEYKVMDFDVSSIEKALSKLLKRPEKVTEEWASQVVVFTYPCELLHYFDLWDLPGTSSEDDGIIQKNISYFLKEMKPTVLFVYSNPAFSNAEVESLKYLDQNSITPFFVRSKLDYDGVLAAQKRNKMVNPFSFYLNFLKEETFTMLSKISSFQRLQVSRERFACIGCRDYCITLGTPESKIPGQSEYARLEYSKLLIQEFKSLLDTFAYRSGIEQISDDIEVIRQCVISLQTIMLSKDDEKTIKERAQDEKDKIETFFKDFEPALIDLSWTFFQYVAGKLEDLKTENLLKEHVDRVLGSQEFKAAEEKNKKKVFYFKFSMEIIDFIRSLQGAFTGKFKKYFDEFQGLSACSGSKLRIFESFVKIIEDKLNFLKNGSFFQEVISTIIGYISQVVPAKILDFISKLFGTEDWMENGRSMIQSFISAIGKEKVVDQELFKEYLYNPLFEELDRSRDLEIAIRGATTSSISQIQTMIQQIDGKLTKISGEILKKKEEK